MGVVRSFSAKYTNQGAFYAQKTKDKNIFDWS